MPLSSRIPLIKKAPIASAIAIVLCQSFPDAFAQGVQPEVEELVVTGTFIRRSEGMQAASPIFQMSAEELALEGTVNMGEVVQNLTFNQGSSITSTTQGTSDVSTSFNLRGLGASSTLLLMDGIRVISDNVNITLPSIAMQRMDIVTDGAAALYGSSAVAGVVNIVPLKEYQGFKLEYAHEGDDRGDFSDGQLSALWGTRLENRINIVLAAEHRDQGRLDRGKRPELLRAGISASSISNPGRYLVPIRDDQGNLTGQTVTLSDPNCGGEREDPVNYGSNPNGFTYDNQCWYDFADNRSYRNDQAKSNIFSNLTFDATPDLTLSAQMVWSRLRADERSSTSNPGGRTSELPLIRGEIPGNSFRASDATGRPLFAQDANGDGVPDRDQNGNVVLDPNGIPFNEDVQLTSWRPLGKHGTQPSRLNPDGSFPTASDYRNWRTVLRADFTMPYISSWNSAVIYSAGEFSNRSLGNNFSFAAIEQGLNCDVVNDRDACFSPFVAIDSADLNSQAVMDALAIFERSHSSEKLQTLDAIFSGEVRPFNFELPGGAIGMAVGYQRREEILGTTPTPTQIKGDNFIGIQQNPQSYRRHVDAFFAELLIPILENLELNVALRDEKYSSGPGSTDPKYGVVYSPLNWITLRGTFGDSFIAPTIQQLEAPQSCGLTNVQDPFTVFSAFTASCSQGNPNLIPENARSKSLGVTLLPLQGLTFDLNWNETVFQDRIINSSGADILRADFFQFSQATGFIPTDSLDKPTLEMVQQWVNDPRSDGRIQRNPGNLEQIDRILTGASNATQMTVRASDLDIAYRFDITSFGALNLGVQATYIDSYTYRLSPELDAFEGVGNQNEATGAVPALPRWKANGRLGWSRNNHRINVNVRYVGSMAFDAPKNAYQAEFAYSNYRDVNHIHAWTQADIAYTYRDFRALGGDFAFTLGSRNMFDRQAQKSPMNGGVIGELQDPLGRVVYGRIVFEY